MPHFKPPTSTTQLPKNTITASSLLAQPSIALSDEATKMQHRLHALRLTLEQDQRQREERIKQRKATSKSAADNEQPLSQKEYLKQLQARLEAKKAATKEKVRQVKAAMDKAGEYVAPLGHGQRLALFERVSEEWLKDDDEEGKQAGGEVEVEGAGAQKGGVSSRSEGVVVVEEAKEALDGGDMEDGAVVIVAAEDEQQAVEAEGHAEFVRAREEWLRSLQQPAAAVTITPSRPTTASSSTSTSAPSPSAIVRPSPASSSATASASALSSSLLAGAEFDESASAASFQEARQAWLQSITTTKPRTTTTPTTTSPPLTSQPPPPTERLSCYQCYRLFVGGEGRVGGECGRELCGVVCVEALERVERLRRERVRSMRAMEQRILALQQEQEQLAQQQQQQQPAGDEVEEAEEQEDERKELSGAVNIDELPSSVPLLALPVVGASGLDVAVLDLPVSSHRFTETDEQPEPVIEFPSA